MVFVNEKSSKIVPKIKQGFWENYRDEVKKIDPKLFSIIENISPGKKYKLFEIEYLYGDLVTELGTICIPDKNGVVFNLNDTNIPSKIRAELGYAVTPLILQLTKGNEVYVDTGNRIMPLNIFTPGDLYGLFESIVPFTNCPIRPAWSVSAGARTVFMGANVKDNLKHNRLRLEYGVDVEPAKSLFDQWHTIKTIVRNKNQHNNWRVRILVFSKEWLSTENDSSAWKDFQIYLLVKSWSQSAYIRNKSEISIIWEAFASEVKNKRLKPWAYLIDTIMHNVFLANSAIPGFVIADESEQLLPSKLVEAAYQDVYLLKEYAAMLMHPWRLGQMGKHYSIFYSLANATMLEGSPAMKKAPSMLEEARAVKLFMETFERILKKHDAMHFIQDTHFDYMHNSNDRYGEIMNSRDIANIDDDIKYALNRFKIKVFPHKGPFFRGCIRITKSTKEN